MATHSELFAIAVQHHEAGQLQAAEQVYRQILAVDPNHVDALQLLGLIALAMGQLESAATYIGRAIELHATEPSFHNNLGNVFKAQGKLDRAIDCFRRAVELEPGYDVALYNLGTALQAQGKLDEAIVFYLRALEVNPGNAATYDNLGTAYQLQEKYDEAMDSYRRALHLKPGHAQTHFNLATLLQAQGKFDAAHASYLHVLELKPDFSDARLSCSLLKLLDGDYQRGWQEYEWRWQTEQKTRGFPQPAWDGSLLEQRTLLLHAEQGLGDTIQFIRYAALVKTHNPRATVIVECQRPLAKLLARCQGIDRLIAAGDSLPAFDVHLPLLSLPGIFRTTVDGIPASVPFLYADESLVEEWRERLAGIRGFRIGINWHGRRGQGEHRKRDIPLEYFAALAQLPGVSLIGLQKSLGIDERGRTSGCNPIVDLGAEFDTGHGAFMDTAAIMMNLDLVLSSDTAVPHLAGALGVPVWVALPFVPNWRWLLYRSDCPWYPTMRLFRKKAIGDWAGVFAEIKAALLRLTRHPASK
ncbi:MAG TPA: tetratricopeptide repeat protein [Pirellulaceae bacterium]|jgi:tetratricopeptide (TPR) repeat protein